jgi:mono/diheme cytochrome c family protein
MVWTGVEAGDPHETPWPYQLVEVAVAAFEEAFPATVPTGLPAEDAGWAGYRLFQRACASCHSINGQGGKIGPDLNVPQSIVEYRPEEQIRAYVRDPQTFRYTSMPAHPGLDAADLDALIAYFEAMRVRKRDPLDAKRGERQVVSPAEVDG